MDVQVLAVAGSVGQGGRARDGGDYEGNSESYVFAMSQALSCWVFLKIAHFSTGSANLQLILKT